MKSLMLLLVVLFSSLSFAETQLSVENTHSSLSKNEVSQVNQNLDEIKLILVGRHSKVKCIKTQVYAESFDWWSIMTEFGNANEVAKHISSKIHCAQYFQAFKKVFKSRYDSNGGDVLEALGYSKKLTDLILN